MMVSLSKTNHNYTVIGDVEIPNITIGNRPIASIIHVFQVINCLRFTSFLNQQAELTKRPRWVFLDSCKPCIVYPIITDIDRADIFD